MCHVFLIKFVSTLKKYSYNFRLRNIYYSTYYRSVQPIVLSYYISLFAITETKEDKTKPMYISGAILVGLSVLIVFFMHHTNFIVSAIGMRVRIACSSLIYRKVKTIFYNFLIGTLLQQFRVRTCIPIDLLI